VQAEYGRLHRADGGGWWAVTVRICDFFKGINAEEMNEAYNSVPDDFEPQKVR